MRRSILRRWAMAVILIPTIASGLVGCSHSSWVAVHDARAWLGRPLSPTSCQDCQPMPVDSDEIVVAHSERGDTVTMHPAEPSLAPASQGCQFTLLDWPPAWRYSPLGVRASLAEARHAMMEMRCRVSDRIASVRLLGQPTCASAIVPIPIEEIAAVQILPQETREPLHDMVPAVEQAPPPITQPLPKPVATEDKLETAPAEILLTAAAAAPESKLPMPAAQVERGREIQLAAHEESQLQVTEIRDVSRTRAAQPDPPLVEVVTCPALQLKVFDLDEAVPEGGEVDYLLQVTNAGSLHVRNLGLRLECPLELKPVAVMNRSDARIAGQIVELSAFDLAPNGTKLFRVKLKGVRAGDARVLVSLTADELRQPVIEEESTRVYAAR